MFRTIHLFALFQRRSHAADICNSKKLPVSYKPSTQIFQANGMCLTSQEDVWVVGSMSSKEAVVKFESSSDYSITFAKNFEESIHTTNEYAFHACKVEGNFVAILGYEHPSILFLDHTNYSIALAQETNGGSVFSNLQKSWVFGFHWHSASVFDFRNSCVVAGANRYLHNPFSVVTMCLSGPGTQGVLDLDIYKRFNAAANYRNVDFVHILPSQEYIVFINGFISSSHTYVQGVARISYVKDSSSGGSVMSKKVLRLSSSIYGGDPIITQMVEGASPFSLSCLQDQSAKNVGFRVNTYTVSYDWSGSRDLYQTVSTPQTCAGVGIDGKQGFILTVKATQFFIDIIADVTASTFVITQKKVYNYGNLRAVTFNSPFSNSRFLFMFLSQEAASSNYMILDSTLDQESCAQELTAASSITFSTDSTRTPVNDPHGYFSASDASSYFKIAPLSYVMTDLAAQAATDRPFCEILIEGTPETDQTMKTNTVLAHSISSYTINFDSCDPANPITGTDISYSVELAGGGAAPSWFNLNTASGTFNFSPTAEISSDQAYDIVVKASGDNTHFDREKTFRLTVQPNNKAPVLGTKPTATLQCYIGSTCDFEYSFSDANPSDVHTVEFGKREANPLYDSTDSTSNPFQVGSQAWLSKDSSKVYVQALAANIGIHTLVLRVEDNNSVSDADGTQEDWYEMTLTVLYQPNSAPICPGSLADLTIDNEGAPFVYTLFSVTDADAADSHTYTVTSAVPAAPFISITGSLMTITVSPLVTASYALSIEVEDDNTNNGANGQLKCSVALNLNILGTNYPPAFSTALQLDFKETEQESLTYFYPSVRDLDSLDTHTIQILYDGNVALPSFVTYDQTAIYIQPERGDEGNYYLVLELSDDNSSLDMTRGSLTTQFFLKIEVEAGLNLECFDGSFPDSEVQVSKSLSLTMEDYLDTVDCVGNQYSYKLDSGSLPTFMSFNQRNFYANPTVNSEQGTYQVEVWATQPGTRDYFVTQFSVFVSELAEQEDMMPDNGPISSDQDENVEIDEDFSFEITQITQLGEIYLEFNFDLLQLTKDLELYSTNSTKAFTLTYLSETLQETESRNLIKSWKLTNIKNSKMIIKMNLTDPFLVSQVELDEIEVKVLNNFLLVSKDKKRIQNDFKEKAKIPLQILEADFIALTSIGSATSTLIASGGIASLILNLLLASSLRLIWKMLGAIQLIVHMPMLNVQHPQNATYLYSLLVDLVNFKFINVDFILEKTMGVKNKVKGYGDNMIFSLGMLFLGILALFLFILALYCAQKLLRKSGRMAKIKKFFFSIFFFNFFIRMFIQSYLTLTLSAMLNIKNLDFMCLANSVSSVLALLMGFLLNIYPGFMLKFLHKYRLALSQPRFKDVVGTMYQGLELDNGFAPLLYNVIFVFRRLIFVYIIVLMAQLPFLQIQLLIMSSNFVVVYTSSVQPFIDNSDDILDIVNEFTIMTLCYFSTAYTQFVQDNEIKYKIGWIAIALVLLNLIVNFSFIIFKTVLVIVKKVSKKKKEKKMQVEDSYKNSQQQKEIQNEVNQSKRQLLYQIKQDIVVEDLDNKAQEKHFNIVQDKEKIKNRQKQLFKIDEDKRKVQIRQKEKIKASLIQISPKNLLRKPHAQNNFQQQIKQVKEQKNRSNSKPSAKNVKQLFVVRKKQFLRKQGDSPTQIIKSSKKVSVVAKRKAASPKAAKSLPGSLKPKQAKKKQNVKVVKELKEGKQEAFDAQNYDLHKYKKKLKNYHFSEEDSI